MKAKIDQDKCLGCGICANVCPTGITMSGGKAKVVDASVKCLQDAVNACPIGIISLQ